MNTHARLLALMVLAAPLGCSGTASRAEAADATVLIGTWKVDLRPTSDAEPYFQGFVVEEIEGDTTRGTFYGTPIENGRVNTDGEAVHFAFTTADGSGAYNTSGALRGSGVRGTTHSLGRGFLAVWSAERAP